MLSTFFGLELSRRAMETQQTALDITGHNIANANTEGYTRQIASMKVTSPTEIPVLGHNLSLGTGVTLDYIERARDNFVDRQYRWETTKQQYWSTRQDSLQKIEGLMNEPSENSLHDDMDKFWNAWSDLSKNPENMGARSVVRERALALTDSFHHIAQQITDMQKDLDTDIRVQIHQINTNAQQIKDLNDQIKRAEVSGDNPNDLRDKRDQLVDELSKIVSVRVIETKDPRFTDREVNSFKVLIGNDNNQPALVDDSITHFLKEPDPPGANGKPFATVQWEEGKVDNSATPPQDQWGNKVDSWGNTINLGDKMGALQANIEARGDLNGDDGYLTNLMAQFDTLAQGIANAVNIIHRKGQGLSAETQTDANGPLGIDFFTDGTESSPYVTPASLPSVTAASIELNSTINNDLGRIATGEIPKTSDTPPAHALDADGLPLVTVGDGSIAQSVSSLSGGWTALQTEITSGMFGTSNGVNLGPVPAASFGDYYGANIAQLGVDVQQANRMKDGQDVLVTHISNQRESYSGVSLDEEMTNLVKFQKSYAAAARMVTMMDDMLNTIINGMGITR